MAQIDREEGNQSALGEALNSYNHSHTFRKKRKGERSPIYSHSQTIMSILRAKEGRLRLDKLRGIIKKSWSMELAKTFPKKLSPIVLTTIFSLPRPNGPVMSAVIKAVA